MKILGILIGVSGLLVSAFYGFASSPDYGKILAYSIISGCVAILGFALWLYSSSGWHRVLPAVGLVLIILVLVQDVARLTK